MRNMTITSSEQSKIIAVAGKIITYAVPVIGLVVPLLYFVGRIRSEAYWNKMQVPPGVMTYGFEDYVYTGFAAIPIAVAEAFSWWGMGPLGAWLTAVLVSAFLTGLTVAVRRLVGRKLQERAVALEHKLRSWRESKPIWLLEFAVPFFKTFEHLCSAFLAILLPLLVVISVIVWADRSGKRVAERDLGDVRSLSEGEVLSLIHFSVSDKELTGIAVGCAGDWCAVRRGEKTVVISKTAVSKIDQCQIVKNPPEATLCPPATALSSE